MKSPFNHTIATRVAEVNEFKITYRCIECESVTRMLHTYSVLLTVYKGGEESDSFIFDITENRSVAIKILDILADNTVTATDLEAVIDSVFDIIDV